MVDTARVRRCLRDFDFKTLFVEELGWDHHTSRLDVSVDGQTHALSAIAHKRGMVAFLCSSSSDGSIPAYRVRRQIDQQATKSGFEHLIVYVDQERTAQVWQWVKRETGRPSAYREHVYHRGQPVDAMIQKLGGVAFGFEEEESLTIVHVAGRARAAFDVERVTKRFYDRFKAEHVAFLRFLRGIPDEEMQRWYVSVMLNRLMFIYFVQKKGFLDNNPGYLRSRLAESKGRGRDLYYSGFLCPLFFEGFAKKESERPAAINQLLGKAPYLNGGLFLRHQIEEAHGKTIEVPDAAFEKLFDFFDGYQWHLDERPLRADNEINPDVLGYIFEKYINQKQMGAYYTKDDITGYIGKNTVIPYLFDAARQKCRIAFDGEGSVWSFPEGLQADPDRYIYPAVKKGVTLALPPEIAAGLSDVSRRTEWNRPAPEAYALPTEIWRDVVARRQRYEQVRAKMVAGEIQAIDDLITHNLDILLFAQDVVESCEGPELLRAFYQSIERVTVLDPTCGSGAFLFAALNILEPLYEACLERMEAFLEELERSGEKHHPAKYADFRRILQRVAQHPNRRYFVLKSIVVNNLYGVDIMEEAVEICKLRLFLKLVAQIERVGDIEPLPDIDFNIRAGNTLVGYANYEDVKRAVGSKLDFDNVMERIEEKAQDVDRLFEMFRLQQTELGGEVTASDKEEVRKRLQSLEDELNRYLAAEQNVVVSRSGTSASYLNWLSSHQPFHWFIGFHGIMKTSGFSVIIGNPPYVEYSKVKDTYTVRGCSTESCQNLYPFILERSFSLMQPGGRLGMIVPLSAFCTQRMKPLVTIVERQASLNWISHFGWRPAKLFDGVNIPLSILISHRNPRQADRAVFTTDFVKWYQEQRDFVFSNLNNVNATPFLVSDFIIPKVGDRMDSILWKVFRQSKTIAHYASPRATEHVLYYRNTGGLYWRIITDFPPFFSQNGVSSASSTQSLVFFRSAQLLSLSAALLNSNFFWLYYVAFSCFHHVNPWDILNIPINFDEMNPDLRGRLLTLSREIMKDLAENSVIDQRVHKNGPMSRFQTFYPARSKSIIDKIDRELANHYGFTDEELDFIVNYDIKYRMGRESLEEGEE